MKYSVVGSAYRIKSSDELEIGGLFIMIKAADWEESLVAITFGWTSVGDIHRLRWWNAFDKIEKVENFKGHLSDTTGDHFLYAPSQWETTLYHNVVSHWPCASTKWPLYHCDVFFQSACCSSTSWHMIRWQAHGQWEVFIAKLVQSKTFDKHDTCFIAYINKQSKYSGTSTLTMGAEVILMCPKLISTASLQT